MKRQAVLVASACLALASACLGSAAAAGGRQPRLPDLIITQFGLQSWGTCAPNKILSTFLVRIKNQGTASWVAGPGGGTDVRVRDLKDSGWFADVGRRRSRPGRART